MKTAAEKGMTLWEMFMEKIHGTPPAPETPKVETPADIFNPLKLALGGYVKLETGDFTGATFSVELISEFTRSIGKRKLKSVDYSLNDPDFGKDGTWVTLRVIPKDDDKAKFDCVLLRPLDELKDNKELETVLEGDVLKDDDSGVEYQKQGAYEGVKVREVSKDGSEKRLSLNYWDFVNTEQSEPRLYVVEMDTSDRVGVIQTYRGQLVSQYDVKS